MKLLFCRKNSSVNSYYDCGTKLCSYTGSNKNYVWLWVEELSLKIKFGFIEINLSWGPNIMLRNCHDDQIVFPSLKYNNNSSLHQNHTFSI